MTQGCPNRDGYFGKPAPGTINCQFGVEADVQWGDARRRRRRHAPQQPQRRRELHGPGLDRWRAERQHDARNTDERAERRLRRRCAGDASASARRTSRSRSAWDDNDNTHSWPNAAIRCGGNRLRVRSFADLAPDGRRKPGELRRRRVRPHVRRRLHRGAAGRVVRHHRNGRCDPQRLPSHRRPWRSSRPETLVTLRLDDPQENQNAPVRPGGDLRSRVRVVPVRLPAVLRRERVRTERAQPGALVERDDATLPADLRVVLVLDDAAAVRAQRQQQSLALCSHRAGLRPPTIGEGIVGSDGELLRGSSPTSASRRPASRRATMTGRRRIANGVALEPRLEARSGREAVCDPVSVAQGRHR